MKHNSLAEHKSLPLINTSLQRGDSAAGSTENGFNRFPKNDKPLKRFIAQQCRPTTRLKPGVNKNGPDQNAVQHHAMARNKRCGLLLHSLLAKVTSKNIHPETDFGRPMGKEIG